MLGGGGNPAAWWEIDGARTAHDARGTAPRASPASPRATTTSGSPSPRPCRDRPTRGGRRSRPSRTRRPASSASTRAPGCSSPWPLALAAGASLTVRVGHAVSTAVDRRGRGDAAPTSRRPSARESRPARRPRPLLPAVADRPVQRPDPGRRRRRRRAHDWTARVSAECYRPNAERRQPRGTSRGTSARPWPAGCATATRSALSRLRRRRPRRATGWPSRSITRSCRWRRRPTGGPRSAGACAISSCASAGGRPACGCRRPRSTCRPCGCSRSEGVEHTILAPWQAAGHHVETRRPYRVELGGGRRSSSPSTTAACRRAVSFEPGATADADRFARERLGPGFAEPLPDDERAARRDRHRRRAVRAPPVVPRALPAAARRGRRPDGSADAFDVVVAGRAPCASVPAARSGARGSRERTSWSCHHGVLRWSGACPCAADGTLEGAAPRRARAARGRDRRADRASGRSAARLARPVGRPRRLRGRRRRGHGRRGLRRSVARRPERRRRTRTGLLDLMEAQRWRLAMFASDGWFWDDPARPETRTALRAAAWAARRIDALAGSTLERRLWPTWPCSAHPGTGSMARRSTDRHSPRSDSRPTDRGHRPVVGRARGRSVRGRGLRAGPRERIDADSIRRDRAS